MSAATRNGGARWALGLALTTTVVAVVMPLLMIGGLAMAIGVATQYFLVFRSPATAAIATAVVAAAAYVATRASLDDATRRTERRLSQPSRHRAGRLPAGGVLS